MVKVGEIKMEINYNYNIIYNNDMTDKNNLKIKSPHETEDDKS